MKYFNDFLQAAATGFIIGLVALFLLSILSGCAVNMTHPTKAANHSDFYQCQMEGERRAAAWGGAGGANPILFRDFTIDCLKRRGWTRQ